MSNSRYYNPPVYVTLQWSNQGINNDPNNPPGGTAHYLGDGLGWILEYPVRPGMFNNQRGRLCTVQVTSQNISQQFLPVCVLWTSWANMSPNATVLDPNNRHPSPYPALYINGIKLLANNDSISCAPLAEEGPEIMCEVPNVIRLHVMGYNKTGQQVNIGRGSTNRFIMSTTLKFQFYDPESMVQSQKNQINYKTL